MSREQAPDIYLVGAAPSWVYTVGETFFIFDGYYAYYYDTHGKQVFPTTKFNNGVTSVDYAEDERVHAKHTNIYCTITCNLSRRCSMWGWSTSPAICTRLI